MIYYKPDYLTYSGTAASGQKKNCLYKFPVPAPTISIPEMIRESSEQIKKIDALSYTPIKALN